MLKDIRNWDKNVVRVQDKRLRFVFLENEDYIKKLNIKLTEVLFND